MSYQLELRQRITVLQNRFDVVRVDGGEDLPLAYAEQKRMALKEKITFYTDQSTRTVAFTLAARNIFELVGTYDISEPSGNVLATLRKDPVASLARSTYNLETAQGSLVGRERTWWRPLARRAFQLASDLPWLLPLQFDFTSTSGDVVISVDRQLRVRDQYRITVNDDAFDWRVAAACAVAVDALMNR